LAILYEHVNLLAKIDNIGNFQKISHSIVIPYCTHIHTLYIYVDSSFHHLRRNAEKYAAGILSTCRQLGTLGLYYYYGSNWSVVSREVVFLAERGKLAHLGIYSRHILEGKIDATNNSNAVDSLIASLAKSHMARQSIKTLELAVDTISMESFTSIYSSFPNLRSISFINALNTILVSQGFEQRKPWMPYRGLRRLQLSRCETGILIQIPSLLHLFPSLTELLVSGLGTRRNGGGWNQPLDIPHHAQNPLECLHVETMNEQEVRNLVNIHTKVLMTVMVEPRHILRILRDHANPFPGLKILRIESPQYRFRVLPGFCDLRDFCKRNNLDVRCDASPIFSSI
jgi:hypothetical protein